MPASDKTHPAATAAVDTITFEVVRNGLYAICEEMKSKIMRASFSPLLSLSADLSCAVLDAEGNVVAQGNDIPVHLGAMPHSARGILKRFPAETWRPGDAVLCNDPYSGGSHLPDMTLLTGAFAGGTLVGFAASRVHWPDVGGAAPGSSAVTDEIFKEGLRVPPVRIVKGGAIDEELWSILFANVRVPDDRVGDFQAQIAGNARGVDRLEGLAARYGAGALRQILQETQNYSQRLMEDVIAAIPDGTYRAADHLDGDGYIEDYGDGPLQIAVSITKAGRSLHCDFTGTARQARGPMNAPLAVTASACNYLLLALADGQVQPNSGAYRPLRLTAPEGTLVNPRYPAAVVAGNTEMSTRLVDLLLQALAPAAPRLAIGASYGCAGVWTVSGIDPRRGQRFVHYETVGGGMGASGRGPGLDGHRVHMGNTMNLPIEAVEAAIPVRIDAYELIDGSGGKGIYPGGMGARRVVRALADGVQFALLFERAHHPARGAAGGDAGKRARFSLRCADGSETALASKTTVGQLDAGDVLIMETAGGGGWGAPDTDAAGKG
ncbi:MAG TPA: hydantoinase B/oxoprolinase family protein [Dongiaceae bacterium]|nr:hydantoinase B/oxoprolinase family protein [Dongiaceae bacterium]